MKKPFSLLLCALCLSLFGCAAQRPSPMPADAHALWDGFVSISRPDAQNHLAGSLRIGPEQDTRRVTYALWSVNQPGSPAAIRMEIFAGAGARACSALFTDDSMLVLMHQEKTAWTGAPSRRNMERLLGARLPLSISQLYGFISGDYYHALGSPVPQRAESTGAGTAAFHFPASADVRRLELGADSRPISLSGAGWELALRYGDDRLPSRLSGNVRTPDAVSRFILLAKERSRTDAASASLPIPPGYQVLPIDE